MNTTPTPRTDENFIEYPQHSYDQFRYKLVRYDFACELERELAAVTEQRDEALSKLELNMESVAKLIKIRDEQQGLISQITEQRDKWIVENEKMQLVCDKSLKLAETFKEQRDRLADACEAIAKTKGNSSDIIFCQDICKQVLQSLKE